MTANPINSTEMLARMDVLFDRKEGGYNQGGWDALWKDNTTPWDLGYATPPLVSALAQSPLKDLPSNARILCPGCGGGHDVVAWAKTGRDVTGLDLSEAAAARAREKLVKNNIGENARILTGDFFTWVSSDGPYDVVYDYTFMVAFPPELRQKWADKVYQLVKPGGLFCMIVFPIAEYLGGPPYAVSIPLMEDLLSRAGFEKKSITMTTNSAPSRQGMEALGLWTKPMREALI